MLYSKLLVGSSIIQLSITRDLFASQVLCESKHEMCAASRNCMSFRSGKKEQNKLQVRNSSQLVLGYRAFFESLIFQQPGFVELHGSSKNCTISDNLMFCLFLLFILLISHVMNDTGATVWINYTSTQLDTVHRCYSFIWLQDQWKDEKLFIFYISRPSVSPWGHRVEAN